MNSSTIPIFPLSLVVFPESKYPLHIFEEKYRRMVRRCLSNGEGFGIVAQIRKELSKVGSYVRVADILTEYENGESDIIVQALNRFILIEYHIHPDGYYEALIDNFPDLGNVIINQNSLEELKEKFEMVIDKVNFKLEDTFWKNYLNSRNKSYKIAEKSGLSLEQQQNLLSIRDENKRINFLVNHLENLEKQIEKGIALKDIILGDGYINN
jgi:Lon protease-like protein